MRLHESHDEGGFGVSNNTITRHAASYTTNARFVASWSPLPAPLSRSDCQATTSRTPQVGLPPPSARSSACTGTSCSSTTAPSSRQWHSPRSRPQAAALLPTRTHTRSLTQAPRTTATASSSYRNSTAFIWHSSGVGCPPRRLPALRTSSPSISRSPSSLPSAVSRNSSPRIGLNVQGCSIVAAPMHAPSRTSLLLPLLLSHNLPLPRVH